MKFGHRAHRAAPGVGTANADLPEGPRFSVLDSWSFVYRPRPYYAGLRRRFGDIVTLRPPRVTLVMALSSEGASQVFGASPDGFGAFQKAAFSGLAGQGSLWVLEGERHRCERRLLSPPFHASRVPGYAKVMQETVLRYMDSWQPGQSIRAYEAMLDISRDIILSTVLGLEDRALMDEGHDLLARLLQHVHPWISFGAEFQSWWFPPWVRFRRTNRRFSAFVARCLEHRRALGRESHDLLGLMLTASHPDGTSMRDDEIRDELATVLMSGHETTAVALAWAIYELGRHPAVLARLREELDALQPDPDVIVKQPYLGAVCDETLRLHTILTEVARTTVEPLELLGHTLPPGIGIGVAISAIHQDPSIYPDPERFMPERFIDRVYGPFEFLPFGGSHRRCLGAAFSDYEMRIALAAIVTRWEFELAGGERETRHNIAMGPKHGVRVRMKRRRGLA
jgi:cytochrome P450